MGDGYVYRYESQWSTSRAASWLDQLETSGLSLVHHDSKQILTISNAPDDQGAYVLADRETVIRGAALEGADRFDFKFWVARDIDVFCTVRLVKEFLVAQELWIDALTSDQQRIVIDAVLTQVRQSAESTEAIVVDRTGNSEDVDWDVVAKGEPGRISSMPDLIGLREKIAEQLHPELHAYPSYQIGELVLYDRSGLLEPLE